MRHAALAHSRRCTEAEPAEPAGYGIPTGERLECAAFGGSGRAADEETGGAPLATASPDHLPFHSVARLVRYLRGGGGRVRAAAHEVDGKDEGRRVLEPRHTRHPPHAAVRRVGRRGRRREPARPLRSAGEQQQARLR